MDNKDFDNAYKHAYDLFKYGKKNEKHSEAIISSASNNKIHAKTAILILFICAIIIQCVFFIPCNQVNVYISKQNVPHAEIVSQGYTEIYHIQKGFSINDKNGNTIQIYDKIDTQRLSLHILIILMISIALFLLVNKKDNFSLLNGNNAPTIDFDSLMFADEETQNSALQKYTENLSEYIFKQYIFKLIIPVLIVTVFFIIIMN